MRARAFLPVALLSATLAASAAAQGFPSSSQRVQDRAPAAEEEAEIRAGALDNLFEMLLAANSAEAAQQIDQVIWALWLQSGNDEADRLMSLAIVAMQIGDFPLAREHLDAAIALEPDFSEAWNKRATVYFLEGDYAHSLEDIDVVLNLEPRHFGALSGLGMILERLDRKEDALSAYRRVLKIHPQLPGVQAKVQELAVEVEGIEL